MVLLGIDPGAPAKPTPTNRTPVALHGWCLLDVQPGERPRWVDAGHDREDTVRCHLRTRGVSCVAVECPARVHTAEAGMSLLATAFEAGRFHGCALEMGLVSAVLTAEHWRQRVTGLRSPTDAQVKTALARLLTLPARSNAHERDAAGVALGYALWTGALPGGRGRLTPRPAGAA